MYPEETEAELENSTEYLTATQPAHHNDVLVIFE